MQGIPIVIIANKQDLPGSLTCAQIVDKMKLQNLVQTKNTWFIQNSCAITGEGIFEAMKQMSDMIKEMKKKY